jgi:TonB family protein
MKQAVCAVILSVALPVLANPQDSTPVVNLETSVVCRSNSSDRGVCITPPRQINSPNPKRPKIERKARHEGMVALNLVVSSEGVPHDITVSKTLSLDFDNAAIEAVKQWKFSPGISPFGMRDRLA